MPHIEPTRSRVRRNRSSVFVALVILGAALVGVLASCQSPASSFRSAAFPVGSPRGDHEGALGEADGAVPEGVTVFDDEIPAVGNLDSDLLRALRAAAAEAADDGVQLHVNSGWRSEEYQEQLFREAVVTYGSEARAARWAATADTSSHVSGDAVDIGDSDATACLSRHGAEYGLCQTYRNEPWHYELRPEAAGSGCPAMYDSPAEDPRLRQ